jgi:pimeloyl-ACP methyl ester carboxylesterase
MGPMPRATSNGIELEYETFRSHHDAVPLLLISGLGGQMIGWDVELCELLASRGFLVIRFDNRDMGLSTWMETAYALDDMAADAAGLLDALEIAAAHVLGVSMGGFIAQLVALNHPNRVLTLTSVMSGPGGEDEVPPTDEATQVLLVRAPKAREERIEVGLWAKQKLLGSVDPYDEVYERARVTAAVDRAYHPAGFARQLGAIVDAPSRLERLRSLRLPVLVIHGKDDILVPLDNGRKVAAAIRGARLIEIEGMGHDLPKRVWAQVAEALSEVASQNSTVW